MQIKSGLGLSLLSAIPFLGPSFPPRTAPPLPPPRPLGVAVDLLAKPTEGSGLLYGTAGVWVGANTVVAGAVELLAMPQFQVAAGGAAVGTTSKYKKLDHKLACVTGYTIIIYLKLPGEDHVEVVVELVV